MTSRVSSKNKEKKAKRKNGVKKKRDQTGRKKKKKKKKKRYRETENSVAGSRNRFICTFKQLLDHCPRVTQMIGEINFVISKQFFSAIDAV